MDKAYEALKHDKKWQQFWEDKGLSDPDKALAAHPKPSGQSYSLVMPPPNVTGVLHLGHSLMLALQDTLIRWRRMKGDRCLYLPGSDHASIAVNMQVVKALAAEGIDYRKLGREKFLERCWQWIQEYQPRIFGQIRKMGVSCDWSRVRFTMDEKLNAAVMEAFERLHKKSLIYKAERLVNWTPKGQTVLSDLEVLYEERKGSLWHLRYPVVGEKDRFVVVATTRPETLLGDTAVAVHPEDERYKDIVGKKVMIPVVNREVEVLADDFVDRDFGTGVVKITPAHDFNDFEVGKRHNLEMIKVLNKDATILPSLGGDASQFEGLDRFKAREKIVDYLQGKNLIEKIEEHQNRVGISERFGDVVEPHLSEQWYVKMSGMAEIAADKVHSGELEFIPSEFKNQFLRWMEGIQDWCVSRQLWWGQQIPVYYNKKTKELKVSAQEINDPQWERDPDVLDTWFSSGLWPFSTMGWPDENNKDLKEFFPNSVMETGFDILFFWVARMVMMSLELKGELPFKKVYLHPMVRDEYGKKMSKTKGNVVDPLEVVDEVGADTLRLTLNALCVQGRDMRLSLERLQPYRNFINKLWNASKFVFMGDTSIEWRERPTSVTSLHDRWILNCLDRTTRDVDKAWSQFRMMEAAEKLYHFVWNDFCDWYLESTKTTRTESQPVLLHVLGETLKLLHPLIPHVTEEIWHAMPGVRAEESISVALFPEGDSFADTDAMAEFAMIQELVSGVRNLRSENKVKPSVKLPMAFSCDHSASTDLIRENELIVKSLAGLDSITYSPLKGQSTKVVGASIKAGCSFEAQFLLGDLVDLDEEKKRLQKELDQLRKVLDNQKKKLGNERFVSKAPPEIVEKEKIKLNEVEDKLARTKKTLEELGGV